MSWILIITVMIIILAVIAAVIFYLGNKIRKLVDNTINKNKIIVPKLITWLVFVIVVAILIYTRSFLAGAIYYSILLFILSDILSLILKKTVKNKKIRKVLSKIYSNGISVIIIAVIVAVYSLYCSCVPVSVSYDVDINKQTDGIKIVMLSDIHFGTATFESDLQGLVNDVNSYSADVVFLCGDIFDENTTTEQAELLSQSLGKFKSKYGTYFIDGNHDKGVPADYVQLLKKNNINVMFDDVALIDDSFYIIGRKDAYVGYARLSIQELTKDLDKSKPIILLDHQPTDTENAKIAGVDLQLSGHTHGGQIWPVNYISSIFNDVNYGMETNGNYNIIVSSGYGIWGFPVRFLTRSELVYIEVH